MGVKDLLARNAPTVPTNVIPVRVVLSVHEGLRFVQQGQRGLPLFRHQIKNGLTVPYRDNDPRSDQHGFRLLQKEAMSVPQSDALPFE
jgi:hypothetical protein